jgi:hypothetical protein
MSDLTFENVPSTHEAQLESKQGLDSLRVLSTIFFMKLGKREIDLSYVVDTCAIIL